MTVRLIETEEERELRDDLELYKNSRSKSCRKYLEYTIKNCKDPSLLRYLATQIAENEALNYFEPLIADNCYAPYYILEELTSSRNPLTRACVAFNLNTPAGSVLMLKNDENEYVRLIASKNPNLPRSGILTRFFERINHFINYLKCLLGFN
ncbi:MAG TPA: hypothetical protein PKU93_02100 [Candidatus Pacearchaeota archaeon]|nr:hypothetical protein [Candidatus Pacearchaeota archaeon]